jgi:hypothetical protein
MRNQLLVTSSLAVVLLGAAACSSSPSAQSPGGPRQAAPAPAAPSGQGSTPVASAEPGIVAVTARGALVVLSSSTGAVIRTLVPGGTSGALLGDEIAVSPDGSTVYFVGLQDCAPEIESVPADGGSPVDIAPGTYPAISPDGSRLAFADVAGPDPALADVGCPEPDVSQQLAQDYSLVVRTVGTSSQTVYPMAPDDTGQPADVITHLSWAPGGGQLVLSVTSGQVPDQDQQLLILDTATARYYTAGTGVTAVPVSGSPDTSGSYYDEGVYLPDGNLFVGRDCCDNNQIPPAGSNLMQEVSPAGGLVRQVAATIQATLNSSVAADSTGSRLLYVSSAPSQSGPALVLYVSQGGATPEQIATGMAAAAWL